MELWDAYSKDFSLIEGATLIRGESIPEGMYHLVCDIIDGTKDCIVFQEGETIAYRWVSAEYIKSMSKSELVTHRIQQFIDELH